MKKNSLFLIVALLTTLFSCNSDEKVNSNGFIRIGVVTNTSVITKAEEDVEIKSIRLVISNITENSSDKDWSKEYNFAPNESIGDIELAPGKYKLVAIASNGSETLNGFNPVYRGETTAEVIAGETRSAQLECKLTTVKVSVEYDQNLKDTYQTEYKTVVGGVTFSSDEEGRAGYITPGDLSVDFMFKNNAGSWQAISLEKIAEAKAREYYKIKISMKSMEGGEGESSEGAANITIQVGEENPQDIEIGIELPKVIVTTLGAENVEYASATLKGSYSSPSDIAPKNPEFKYRVKGLENWSSITATVMGATNEYTASVTLEPGTTYEYSFMGKGNVLELTTKDFYTTLEEKVVGMDVAYVYGILNKETTDAKVFEYQLASESENSIWKSVNATKNGEGKYEAIFPDLEKGKEYRYRFSKSKTIQTLTTCSSITVQSVTAGADYAKIKWDIESPVNLSDTDQIIVSYKYKKEGNIWGEAQVLTLTMQENGNKIILAGLEQGGTYYVDDETKLFTTLKNANFDTWSSKKVGFISKKTLWFANETTDYVFWATGNEGVTSAIESNTYPIAGRDGMGQHAAKMESASALGVFAAGNLYVGRFDFNLMDIANKKEFPKFGQTFGARPTGLKGWYQYTSKNISDSEKDKCEIYVKLFTGERYNANTMTSKTYIAEGGFNSDADISSWTSFEFDIKYNDTITMPTMISIVATSSINGGDFVGAVGSALCIDDFELIYDYTKPPYTN